MCIYIYVYVSMYNIYIFCMHVIRNYIYTYILCTYKSVHICISAAWDGQVVCFLCDWHRFFFWETRWKCQESRCVSRTCRIQCHQSGYEMGILVIQVWFNDILMGDCWNIIWNNDMKGKIIHSPIENRDIWLTEV
jgi:hypothetical protein